MTSIRRLVAAPVLVAASVATAVVAIAPSAQATPISCSSRKVNSTTGSAICNGGSGKARVVIRCKDNMAGTSSTQYGPYVGIGKTSTHQCYPAQRSGISYVDYQTTG